jgi:prolyl-tRNA synthetase
MKDSYSFDLDDDAFRASYDAHRAAYIRIFDRLGFDYVIVAAMSGAMGGSASEEFLATAANGEDTYVRCTTCDYAANVEAVRVPHRPRRRTTTCPQRTLRTPRTPRPSTRWWRIWSRPFRATTGGLGPPLTRSRTSW